MRRKIENTHIAKVASSAFKALVVAVYLFLGPVFVAIDATNYEPLHSASGEPWIAIVVIGFFAVLFAFLSYLAAREITKASDKSISVLTGTIFALFIVASASYFIGLGGAVLVRLAAGGCVIMHEPSQATAAEGLVYQQLLWHAADTVPVLNIPNSLGWERPVKDPAAPLGVTSVMLRLVMLFVVIASAKTLVQHARIVLREDRVPNPDSSPGEAP